MYSWRVNKPYQVESIVNAICRRESILITRQHLWNISLKSVKCLTQGIRPKYDRSGMTHYLSKALLHVNLIKWLSCITASMPLTIDFPKISYLRLRGVSTQYLRPYLINTAHMYGVFMKRLAKEYSRLQNRDNVTPLIPVSPTVRHPCKQVIRPISSYECNFTIH